MVFKSVSGVNVNPAQLWESEDLKEHEASLDVSNAYKDHYKNSMVLNWEKLNVTKVGGVLWLLTSLIIHAWKRQRTFYLTGPYFRRRCVLSNLIFRTH